MLIFVKVQRASDLEILFIWLSKDSSLSVITPKIVSHLLFLKFFLETYHLHIFSDGHIMALLRVQYHISFKIPICYCLKSVWRFILAKSRLFPVLYRLLLSAQFLKKHYVRKKTKSFINKSNNSGASIDPCGTSAMISFQSESNCYFAFSVFCFSSNYTLRHRIYLKNIRFYQ